MKTIFTLISGFCVPMGRRSVTAFFTSVAITVSLAAGASPVITSPPEPRLSVKSIELPETTMTRANFNAKDLAAQYGFDVWNITSWVGNSVTAYLSERQFAALTSLQHTTGVLYYLIPTHTDGAQSATGLAVWPTSGSK